MDMAIPVKVFTSAMIVFDIDPAGFVTSLPIEQVLFL